MDKRRFIKSLGALSFSPLISGSELSNFRPISKNLPFINNEDELWKTVRSHYTLKDEYINLESGYYNIIPDPILELIKFRVAQSHKYRAILGAEMYSIDKALEAGLLDEIVSPDDLAKTVNEKAKDLATMGHPSYTMTKELFIAEPLKKINQAIVDLHSNS